MNYVSDDYVDIFRPIDGPHKRQDIARPHQGGRNAQTIQPSQKPHFEKTQPYSQLSESAPQQQAEPLISPTTRPHISTPSSQDFFIPNFPEFFKGQEDVFGDDPANEDNAMFGRITYEYDFSNTDLKTPPPPLSAPASQKADSKVETYAGETKPSKEVLFEINIK